MQHDGGPQSIRFCGCGRDCCIFRLKSHHHVSILTHTIFDARLGMEKRLELRRVAGIVLMLLGRHAINGAIAVTTPSIHKGGYTKRRTFRKSEHHLQPSCKIVSWWQMARSVVGCFYLSQTKICLLRSKTLFREMPRRPSVATP